MRVLARGKSASAVAASAYISRARRKDNRTWRRYGYRKRRDLIATGLIGWYGSAAKLWNAAEAAETRCNARTGREFKIAIPAELSPEQMEKLVRGFCLFLRDKYGVACEWAIHAPKWLDPDYGKRVEDDFDNGVLTAERLHRLRQDGNKTNKNYHCHIVMTCREVDRETAVFGSKTRVLDDQKTGPQHVDEMRAAWTRRVNLALKKAGHDETVDLRSHARRAAAGDGPDGLISEPHLGLRAAVDNARTEKRCQQQHVDKEKARKTARRHNKRVNACWAELKRLEREKKRLLRQANAIAAQREAERREAAAAEIAAVLEARSYADQKAAFEAATSVFATDARHGVDAINRRYSDCEANSDDSEKEPLEEKQAPPSKTNGKVGEGEPINEEVGNKETEPSLQDIIDDVEAGRAPALAEEFEQEVDMETYVAPSDNGPPPTFVVTKADLIRSAQRSKQMQHTRF